MVALLWLYVSSSALECYSRPRALAGNDAINATSAWANASSWSTHLYVVQQHAYTKWMGPVSAHASAIKPHAGKPPVDSFLDTYGTLCSYIYYHKWAASGVVAAYYHRLTS